MEADFASIVQRITDENGKDIFLKPKKTKISLVKTILKANLKGKALFCR